MRIKYHLSPCGNICLQMFPDNLKEANDLLYFTKNADKNARAVASQWADCPAQKPTDETLGLYVHLNTVPEKRRTNKL